MILTSNNGHSRFAPSSAHRWLNCPASMTLEANAPESEGNVFAQEGSAAHKLAEMRLCGVMTATGLTSCRGLPMHDVVPAADPERGTYDYLDIVVDADMIDNVQEFLIWIKTQMPQGYSTLNRDILQSECKVVTGIDPEIKGTVDVSITDWPDTLHEIDIKYGQWHQVDAEDNPQLAIYALGAIEKHGDDFETIKMTIYQPRGQGPTVKTWEMSMGEFIKKWTKKIARGHEDCLTKTSLYRPGEWCKYCRGIPKCGRAKRGANRMAKADAIVPSDVKALSRILKSETAVLEYLNDCKKRAFGHLSSGGKVPGFKLVRTWGRKKFKDAAQAEKVLKAQACKSDFDISETVNNKLKTPKQIRKALKDKYPEALDKYTVTPDAGLKLVPDTDKRDAYLGAQQEFANVDSN